MTIKCFRCSKQHLMMEMVMDASGKGMVCRPCAGLKPKEPAQATKPSVRQQFERPKSPQASRGKYGCENCKFRFSSSKSMDQVSCPYCGSRRISAPEEHSADALLRDSGGRDYDF